MENTRLVIAEGSLIQDFQPFHFNQTMKYFSYLDRMHLFQELPGSLSYISCFTICIPLRHNRKYTLWEVILYHYCFLCSIAYQNRYRVLRITTEVPGFISWVVDLEVLGLESWGPGTWGPGSLGPGSWVLILDYAISYLFFIIFNYSDLVFPLIFNCFCLLFKSFSQRRISKFSLFYYLFLIRRSYLFTSKTLILINFV